MRLFTCASLFYFIVASSMFLVGCGDQQQADIDPEAQAGWEEVMHTHGHHGKTTDMFELNSQDAILHVEANPAEDSYNSNLEVYIAEGSEKLYSNPDLHVFNQSKEGNVQINKKPGKYHLYIKAMEMDYKLKIYEQTKESNGDNEDASNDESQDESQNGGH